MSIVEKHLPVAVNVLLQVLVVHALTLPDACQRIVASINKGVFSPGSDTARLPAVTIPVPRKVRQWGGNER